MKSIDDLEKALKMGLKLTPRERAIVRYSAIVNSLREGAPDFVEAMSDEHRPMTGLTCKIKPEGGMYIVIKRDNDLESEVMMSGGEDLIDAILNLSRKISRDDWNPDVTYEERMAKKKQKSK